MKRIYLQPLVILFCLLSILPAAPQGTSFTYQGVLRDGTSPANGQYVMQFALFDAVTNGSAVGSPLVLSPVPVSNGLFQVQLDFGATAFSGDERWLDISVRTNDPALTTFATLHPRQPLTAQPYAIRAAQFGGSIADAQLSQNVALLNAPNSLTNPANIMAGNGAGLTSLNAAQLTSGTVPAPALSNAWRLIGNSGTAVGTHFLGTTDNQALELRVNNQRALRLEPGVAPNLIGGVAGNVVTPGRVGGVIAGGSIQSIEADYGTIGGGQSNTVGEIHGTIGGGAFNRTAGGPASTVSGGFSNAAAGHYTVVAGGLRNTAVGFISTIGGGQNNIIETNADHSTIAGGLGNRIQQGSFRAFIGGGDGNWMQTNADFSVIAGGQRNTLSSNAVQCTIGGGSGNDIGTNTVTCFVGGGFDNNIGANTASSSIVGGAGNDIGTNSDWTVIIGGNDNNIGPNSTFSLVIGGLSNNIGTNSTANAIGGGDDNHIGDRVANSLIAGGRFGNIGDDSSMVAIAGGLDNDVSIDSHFAAIGGGNNNDIGSNTLSCVIAGGEANLIADNSRYATIPGGSSNYATNRAFAAGSSARAIHSGAFVWGDGVAAVLSSTNANSVTMRAAGGYRLFSNNSATIGAFLAPGGGAWAAMSDRNAKENFEPINARTVLEKVAALPMTTWNYKSQSENIRHIGPMAQDFKAAFGVGEAETTITSIDADGVALAAIQGLNQKLQDELKRRDAENAELKQRLTRLEERLMGAKHGTSVPSTVDADRSVR